MENKNGFTLNVSGNGEIHVSDFGISLNGVDLVREMAKRVPGSDTYGKHFFGSVTICLTAEPESLVFEDENGVTVEPIPAEQEQQA